MGAVRASWKSTAGFSIWARERAHPRVVPAEFGACTSAIHRVVDWLIDQSNALVDSSAMSQAELGTCDGAAALARVLELARRPNDVPVHSCGCEERLLASESLARHPNDVPRRKRLARARRPILEQPRVIFGESRARPAHARGPSRGMLAAAGLAAHADAEAGRPALAALRFDRDHLGQRAHVELGRRGEGVEVIRILSAAWVLRVQRVCGRRTVCHLQESSKTA